MGNMDNKNPEVISLRDMGSKSPEASSLQRVTTVEEGEITYNVDGLQRHLGNRQIQLIAIGGSIGTALFVRQACNPISQSRSWSDNAWLCIVSVVLFTKVVHLGCCSHTLDMLACSPLSLMDVLK